MNNKLYCHLPQYSESVVVTLNDENEVLILMIFHINFPDFPSNFKTIHFYTTLVQLFLRNSNSY